MIDKSCLIITKSGNTYLYNIYIVAVPFNVTKLKKIYIIHVLSKLIQLTVLKCQTLPFILVHVKLFGNSLVPSKKT